MIKDILILCISWILNSTLHIHAYFFGLFMAAPVAYGSSQAQGPIGAVASGLCRSHSNTGSEPRLPLIPQLTAKLDP